MSLFAVGDGKFRALAIAEGTSLVLLVGVAVPLKHLAGIAIATRIMGLVHGLLFLLYEAAVLDALGSKRWPTRRIVLSALAAFVPFGTFVVAWHYRGASR